MMSKYFLCFLYVLFSVSGLIIIKTGSNSAAGKGIVVPILNLGLSWVSLIGIICYGISFCLYLGVVSNFKIGIIIPLLGGIVNIVILLASTLILHENLGVKSIVGAAIVIIGIAVMNI